MINGKENSTWPLQDERPDLVASWFDHLRVQTREVLSAMESAAHSGVDSKLTVTELVEAIERLRHQAHFNRALATAMLTKRDVMGLTITAQAEATIKEAVDDIQRLVHEVDGIAFFFDGVAKDAAFYKTLSK